MGRRIHRPGISRLDGGTGAAHERTFLQESQVCDHRWARDLRSAIACTSTFLGLLLSVDAAAVTFTPARVALWSGLALLLFLVLFPPRVTASEGWLVIRTPLRTRRVRTDRLVSARALGRASRRLVLRDSLGGRAELDPRTLVANPQLWHRVGTDIRVAATQGHLRQSPAALNELAEQIDRETAWAVFEISGLTAESDESSAR
ncbi:hypothetical protein ACIRRT_29585 [Streptomyces sp. NPDC102256]|uniref:hypothetical protein n=1 Tax=unclassified Streptomyces TaxID=2593676 RepID=UPI00343FF7EB